MPVSALGDHVVDFTERPPDARQLRHCDNVAVFQFVDERVDGPVFGNARDLLFDPSSNLQTCRPAVLAASRMSALCLAVSCSIVLTRM
jgi:hypothetical protein